MNVANELFQCFVKSIREEIQRLVDRGVLDHCAKQRRHARVLNSILKEDTLRFFALRKLCEDAKAPGVTFDTEYSCDEGRIDLVLVEGAEEYALEFKRWQTPGQQQEILDNDHKKLVTFMRAANHHGYSVIFTDNDNKDMAPEFQHDKQGFYTDAFEECLGGKYSLCDCRVIEFDTFTVCALLAAPNQDARGA